MTIPVRKKLVSKSKQVLKCPYTLNADFITVHNTANDASADAEARYHNGNTNQISFHFAVDDKEVVQVVDTNRNAWHCGDGSGMNSGNRTSIGVEICYSKSGGDRYVKAEALAVKFIAQLLRERGWGVDRVRQHNYWSGKNCPHRIRAEGRWDKFVESIKKELNALNGGKVTLSKPAPVTTKGYLEKGDKGTAVKGLQYLLNEAGANPKLVVDGSFGDSTLKAVKAFQKENGLAVDGYAGNATMQVLEVVTAPKPVKQVASVTATGLPVNVYGTVKVLVDKLNIREKADFNSKVVKVVEKDQTYKAYAQKNGLYNLGGDQYCTANPEYVQFTKNPNYGLVTKTKVLTVIVSELYTYKTADWDDKGQIVKKDEVFTIAKELTVAGSKMYQLKSGLYISANPKYVKVTEK